MLADLVEKLSLRNINVEKQRGKLRDDNLRLRSGKPAVAVGDEMYSAHDGRGKERKVDFESRTCTSMLLVSCLCNLTGLNNNQARLVEEGCVRLLAHIC